MAIAYETPAEIRGFMHEDKFGLIANTTAGLVKLGNLASALFANMKGFSDACRFSSYNRFHEHKFC